MTGVINHLASIAEHNIKISEDDFIKNGLWYCGRCKTPKQCKLKTPLAQEKIVFCLCFCKEREREDTKRLQQQLQEKYRISQMKTENIQDKEMRKWTFATDDDRNPKAKKKALNYCANWAKAYRENIGILFWGNVGNGKTFYAACITNALIERGVNVLMTSFPRIVNALTGFSTQDKNKYMDDFNRYKLLVIDDLGAERQTETTQEIVYNIIDTRYKNGQPLILTTNRTLDFIKNPTPEKKDIPIITYERICSRILNMCIPIKFTGESGRTQVYREKAETAREILGL